MPMPRIAKWMFAASWVILFVFFLYQQWRISQLTGAESICAQAEEASRYERLQARLEQLTPLIEAGRRRLGLDDGRRAYSEKLWAMLQSDSPDRGCVFEGPLLICPPRDDGGYRVYWYAEGRGAVEVKIGEAQP